MSGEFVVMLSTYILVFCFLKKGKLQTALLISFDVEIWGFELANWVIFSLLQDYSWVFISHALGSVGLFGAGLCLGRFHRLGGAGLQAGVDLDIKVRGRGNSQSQMDED